MSQFLPDTNVSSKVFGNNPRVRHFIENLDAVLDATVYIECIQGSKSNREKRLVKKYLDNCPLVLMTPATSGRAISRLTLIQIPTV